ncbi:MAG: hypothetical protein GWP06_10740 [Actinobacteria bacterium]|nr:hypothetical protein [Actinomycetota bacterium]
MRLKQAIAVSCGTPTRFLLNDTPGLQFFAAQPSQVSFLNKGLAARCSGASTIVNYGVVAS